MSLEKRGVGTREKTEARVRKRLRAAVIAAALLVFFGVSFSYAVFHGLILLNRPSEKRYPVRGADVSHYQGAIDWPVLAGQDLDFVYIKATEGSSHTDERFLENWEAAKETGLKVGAYHFFSFDSPAETQLDHFTEVVPDWPGMLPPAVDFEFYGDKRSNPPEVLKACGQLEIMVRGLEAVYGVKPVIYATEETYHAYLEGRFEEWPLWIRNVVTKPSIGKREWLFWQYTNRARLKGYEGEEPYVDMNVFAGTEEEWSRWTREREESGAP